MNARTVTTVLDAPSAEVFAYLADIENLPDWATEFARELKLVGGRHKVVNGLGEFFFELRPDEATGVIDMLAGPSEDELAVFPTRVVGLPDGSSAFTRWTTPKWWSALRSIAASFRSAWSAMPAAIEPAARTRPPPLHDQSTISERTWSAPATQSAR